MRNAASDALRIVNLSVSYGPAEAVRSISMHVAVGEAVAVVGSNGAGKTSMLKGIMGLVPARAATLDHRGEPIGAVRTAVLSRRGIAFVPEGRELFPGLRVEEELLVGGRLLTRGECAARIEQMFELFPRLRERRRQITRTLSGGEQQMVALARALMMGPNLLLLDEPSLGLAPVIQDVVYEALSRLKAQGLSMLLVEQNAYRALNLCDRAYVIELGRMVREGGAQELLADPAVRRAYLGG